MDKLRSELSAHVMEYFVVEVHVVSQHASEHYLYYSSAPPILRVEPLAGRHAEQREAADPNSANRWVVFYSLAQYIWYNSVH